MTQSIPPRIRCAGRSDAGSVRPVNEDDFLVIRLGPPLLVRQRGRCGRKLPASARLPLGWLLAVADGLGGHAGGEEASALVLDELARRIADVFSWSRPPSGHGIDIDATLVEAALSCQARVAAEAHERPKLLEMGSTLTAAWIIWPRLHLLHVGDTRCYLVRGGRLTQLTTDHTYAQRLAEDEAIDPASLASSPMRHILWNAIGGNSAELRPEVTSHDLRRGDLLLLCSDGLTDQVPDEDLRRVLTTEADPGEACRTLIARANASGGRDNITAVVASLGRPPAATPEAAAAAAATSVLMIAN